MIIVGFDEIYIFNLFQALSSFHIPMPIELVYGYVKLFILNSSLIRGKSAGANANPLYIFLHKTKVRTISVA